MWVEDTLLVGSGKQSSVTSKDQLCSAVCDTKHERSWESSSTASKRIKAVFERSLSSFLKFASPFVYKTFKSEVVNTLDKKFVKKNDQKLACHTLAFYATGVMFQKSDRSFGNMLEAKNLYPKSQAAGIQDRDICASDRNFYFPRWTCKRRRSRHHYMLTFIIKTRANNEI